MSEQIKIVLPDNLAEADRLLGILKQEYRLVSLADNVAVLEPKAEKQYELHPVTNKPILND